MRRRRGAVDPVIGEHFIANQRNISGRGDLAQQREIIAVQERPGRIVRRHHQDRAHAIAHRAPHRVDVDAPRAVIFEPVRNGVNRLEPRQVLEQRIAWMRHQDLIAGIAQQLEQQRVGLAGARGERHPVGGNDDAAAAEVGGHGGAGRPHAQRLRIVLERARIRERQQEIRRIGEAHTGRVRFGQVRDRRAAAPSRVDHPRQRVRLEAGGKTGRTSFSD